MSNLTKSFPNGRTVLNGISFKVFPEETFVILGGSGCGKSTLLNILIGVLEPTSGQVRIFGQDLHRLKGAQLKELHIRCGMLFQSGALIESLSLLGNVHLPLREHYRGLDAAVLMETARLKLRMVGLEDHGSKRPSGISGGMKKRVALARALALDPDLVFADEPTSGLDPVSTQEIDEMFIRLTANRGRRSGGNTRISRAFSGLLTAPSCWVASAMVHFRARSLCKVTLNNSGLPITLWFVDFSILGEADFLVK